MALPPVPVTKACLRAVTATGRLLLRCWAPFLFRSCYGFPLRTACSRYGIYSQLHVCASRHALAPSKSAAQPTCSLDQGLGMGTSPFKVRQLQNQFVADPDFRACDGAQGQVLDQVHSAASFRDVIVLIYPRSKTETRSLGGLGCSPSQ